jgi:hypothetical protein
MIHVKDHKQRDMFNPFAHLGKKRLVLIQQMEDCTDADAVDNFALNLKWQYALNITDASDTASYVSPRTLWNLRDIVAQEGLDDALFENVTDALKKLFALDPSKQRRNYSASCSFTFIKSGNFP